MLHFLSRFTCFSGSHFSTAGLKRASSHFPESNSLFLFTYGLLRFESTWPQQHLLKFTFNNPFKTHLKLLFHPSLIRGRSEHNMPNIVLLSWLSTRQPKLILIHYNRITKQKWKGSVRRISHINSLAKFLNFHVTVYDLCSKMSPHCFSNITVEYWCHSEKETHYIGTEVSGKGESAPLRMFIHNDFIPNVNTTSENTLWSSMTWLGR